MKGVQNHSICLSVCMNDFSQKLGTTIGLKAMTAFMCVCRGGGRVRGCVGVRSFVCASVRSCVCVCVWRQYYTRRAHYFQCVSSASQIEGRIRHYAHTNRVQLRTNID